MSGTDLVRRLTEGSAHALQTASASSAGGSRSFSQGHAYDTAKLYTDILYDYEAQRDEELTVRSGDEVGVLQSDTYNGWLLCCLHGRAGLVPSNFLERYQQHSIRITEFEDPKKPARATPMQGDTWSPKLQAAEADVRQLQESLVAMRQDMEKTLGDKAVPLSATDTERVIYDLVKLGMLLEEDSDELTDFGQRLRHAWSELRLLKNEVKVDLSAVPQLGRYRQKIIKNLTQLTAALREEEASRREMASLIEECLNSLVSLRVHMEGKRRDKGDDESSTSSKSGSKVNNGPTPGSK